MDLVQRTVICGLRFRRIKAEREEEDLFQRPDQSSQWEGGIEVPVSANRLARPVRKDLPADRATGRYLGL